MLASEIGLSDKLGLAFNAGLANSDEGAGRYSQFFGSVSLGIDVSERVGAYLEAYAFNRIERGGDSQQFVNGGFTCAIDPNFQWDARLGFGLGNDVGGPDGFTGVGVTRRF